MERQARIKWAAGMLVAVCRGERLLPRQKAELEALFASFSPADTAALGEEITRLVSESAQREVAR
jgi:hypothetical protein